MKVLVDTNVLIDFLLKRGDYCYDSLNIIKLCESKIIDGCLSVISIPNIVYILRKELNNNQINKIIDYFGRIFDVKDLRFIDVSKVANTDFLDFEDALQIECAKNAKCEVIISRDKKHYINSNIEVINPTDFIKKYITNYKLRKNKNKNIES